MLSTREVYNQIQNPLDDIDIIKMLIYGYIDNYPAYFLATNCLYKENKKEDINQKNEFYSLIFNTWKNNIINMNNERISYLLKQGKIEKDFLILKKYLLNIPNMSSVSEIDIFWENIEKDEQIKNILCKYSYEHWSIWHHIYASKILLNDELNFDVEHRLYLNVDLSSIHEIMKYYLEKCFKYNIPFYFKYWEQTTRNDCIVIYTNTDNLAKNIEILREIKKEHPELSSRIYYPPILTGPIDEWIGYGSEPKQQITNISFNEKRSEIIYPIIEKVTKIWYEKTFGKTDLIGYELRDLLRRFAEDIKLNQNYIRMIQEELKKEAKRYDIDENNFSIDNSAKKRMLKL